MGSTAQLESSPCSLQLEKATHSYEDPAQPKYKQINYLNIHNIHVKKTHWAKSETIAFKPWHQTTFRFPLYLAPFVIGVIYHTLRVSRVAQW